MIDLSNNNGTGHDFHRALESGHHRVYLKASEGTGFTDHTLRLNGGQAHHAGMRVGAYHFAHGNDSPTAEFERFAAAVTAIGFPLRLRPALDLEAGTPTAALGRWAVEWATLCRKHLDAIPVFYGSGGFLERCRFRAQPGGLWLASYGRDDGLEHPYVVPRPWKLAAAHQFTSEARVPGIRGHCDVSHVYLASAIDWPGR